MPIDSGRMRSLLLRVVAAVACFHLAMLDSRLALLMTGYL